MKVGPFSFQSNASEETSSSKGVSGMVPSPRIFLTGAVVILTGAAATATWMYFNSTQGEEPLAFSPEPIADPSYPLVDPEDGPIGLFQQGISGIATFSQAFFSLLAPVGLALRLRNEQREGELEVRKPDILPVMERISRRSLLSIEETSAEFTPEMFYSNFRYRSEVRSLAKLISSREGEDLLGGLEFVLSNQMKNWKLVNRNSFFLTMEHSDLQGHLLLFPTCYSANPFSIVTDCSTNQKNREELALASEKPLQAWRDILQVEKDHYDQLIIPEVSFIRGSDGQSFAFKEAIEISSSPIGKDPERARKQFEKFVAELVGYSGSSRIEWGRNVGFLMSFKGKKVEPDEPARIAILDNYLYGREFVFS